MVEAEFSRQMSATVAFAEQHLLSCGQWVRLVEILVAKVAVRGRLIDVVVVVVVRFAGRHEIEIDSHVLRLHTVDEREHRLTVGEIIEIVVVQRFTVQFALVGQEIVAFVGLEIVGTEVGIVAELVGSNDAVSEIGSEQLTLCEGREIAQRKTFDGQGIVRRRRTLASLDAHREWIAET